MKNSLETTHNDKTMEIQVYTRRPWNKSRLVEGPNSSRQNKSSTLNEGMVSMPSNLAPNSSPLFATNLDIPIAIRKGVRCCIKHSLSEFVSYHRIVGTYKAFTSHITLKSILKNVEKALANPKWKKTIDEVTKALKKNGRLGILWIYPKKALSDMQMVFSIRNKADSL